MARDLAVDRLPDTGTPLQVVLVEDASFGSEAPQGVRDPHRHDYHELIWTRDGSGEHLIDGEPSRVEPGTITLIGRGQVHVFQRAERPRRRGHPLRGGDAGRRRGRALADRGPRRAHGRGPAADVAALEATISALAAETQPPVRRPQPRAPAPLPVGAAAVDRALVRRHAHRTARRRRRRPAAPPPLRDRARARLRAPPRRRALRRRARRARRRCSRKALAQSHRPHDQAADHRPRDARGRPAAALHAT